MLGKAPRAFLTILIPSLAATLPATTLGCAATAPANRVTSLEEAPLEPDKATAHIGFHVGARVLDDDFDPVDEQTSFALVVDWYGHNLPFGFELGVTHSSEDDVVTDPTLGDVDTEASFIEVYGGLRKTFALGKNDIWHPYVGGGMSYVTADLEASVPGMRVTEDDESIGFYLRGGIYVDLPWSLAAGVDIRALLGSDIEAFGADGDADYQELSVFLAYSF